MPEVRVMMRGGLGNQLFQASAGLAISRKLSLPLVLDDSFLRTAQSLKPDQWQRGSFAVRFGFPVRYESSSDNSAQMVKFVRRWGTLRRLILDIAPGMLARIGRIGGEAEKDWPYLLSLIPRETHILLDGYFQKNLMFKDYQDEIRMTLTEALNSEISGLGTLARDYFELPAVHIRLGDRLAINHTTVNWYREYLPRALAEYNLLKNAHIVLYSDSPELAAEILRGFAAGVQISLPPETDDAMHVLALMSNHKIFIGAPSTLSWWTIFLQAGTEGSSVMPSEALSETLGIVPDTDFLTRTNFL